MINNNHLALPVKLEEAARGGAVSFFAALSEQSGLIQPGPGLRRDDTASQWSLFQSSKKDIAEHR
jgi:hypothetical protein